MFLISAFYHFGDLQSTRLPRLKQQLEEFANQRNLLGLVIIAPEGVNATIAANEEVVLEFKDLISQLSGFKEICFKDSRAEKVPFRRFKVDIRPEIVTLGRTDIVPHDRHAHVSPAEWDRLLMMDDVVVVDVRNFYEVEVGKFRGAIDPKLTTFGEFPEFVRNSGIPKDKRVLMYCTGGIRCEKALLEMEAQGYRDVLQLDGGILNYFQSGNGRSFEGECFVFDHRVAVDHELAPTKRFGLCPHCGNPGSQIISCLQCGCEGWVCQHCLERYPQSEAIRTCSKAHRIQYRRGLQNIVNLKGESA